MKKETLEKAAEKYAEYNEFLSDRPFEFNRDKVAFICGAEWQKERSYSEEEVLNLLTHFAVEIQRQNKRGQCPLKIKEWFVEAGAWIAVLILLLILVKVFF